MVKNCYKLFKLEIKFGSVSNERVINSSTITDTYMAPHTRTVPRKYSI